MVWTTSPGLKFLTENNPLPAPSISDFRISTFISFECSPGVVDLGEVEGAELLGAAGSEDRASARALEMLCTRANEQRLGTYLFCTPIRNGTSPLSKLKWSVGQRLASGRGRSANSCFGTFEFHAFFCHTCFISMAEATTLTLAAGSTPSVRMRNLCAQHETS